MKERPILFSTPMIRAILDGQKTQTRRVNKHIPSWPHHGMDIMDWSLSGFYQDEENSGPDWWWLDIQTEVDDNSHRERRCPYGAVGDRLWVRETWGSKEADHIAACNDPEYRRPREGDSLVYRADPSSTAQWGAGLPSQGSFVWRPSIHMPRWASRITLEITNIRVERLHDISRGDAMAEGCPFPNIADGDNPRDWYRDLWNTINGSGSWDANPWVWVVEFKRVDQ